MLTRCGRGSKTPDAASRLRQAPLDDFGRDQRSMRFCGAEGTKNNILG